MINWKVRLKNPVFWVHILMAVAMPILAYFGLTAQDMTSWTVVEETLLQAVSNPYVWGIVAVSVWNAVNDPTTKGLSDSTRALAYTKPYEEG